MRFRRRRGIAGFTLIEVLVALSVVAISLSAIGLVVAGNVRGVRALNVNFALFETARAVMTGLPDRNDLALGNFSGELAGHRWRVDVLPFTSDNPEADAASPWLPQTVVVRVQSPAGKIMQIDTVRLRRRFTQ
jgi:general secretion pathway protein I